MPSSEQQSTEAQERIKLASKATEPEAKPAAGSTVVMTQEQLQAEVLRILSMNKPTKASAPQPQAEPDWSNLTELQATNMRLDLNIPVITHDIPAYMDIQLADNEYVAVWANRDQRRIGQLEAEGYEFIRKEHIAKDFKAPLKFDSEGLYIYQDVVAMRVHKRILFGKRRRTQEISVQQLKGVKQIAAEKLQRTVIEKDSNLEGAFEKGSLSFFDVQV